MTTTATPVDEHTMRARLDEEQHLHSLPSPEFIVLMSAEELTARMAAHGLDIQVSDPIAQVQLTSRADLDAWANRFDFDLEVEISLVDTWWHHSTAAHGSWLGWKVSLYMPTEYIPTRQPLGLVERAHRHGVI
jgi:hypothetical protein